MPERCISCGMLTLSALILTGIVLVIFVSPSGTCMCGLNIVAETVVEINI